MSGPRFELVAVAVGDKLIRMGQTLHRRFAVAPPGQSANDLFIRAERYRLHVASFVTLGDPLDFAQRRMIAAGIVTRPGHNFYMGLLRDAGCLKVYPRSGVRWVYPWTRWRFLVLLRRQEITLPYPLDREPPAVLGGRVADAQYAQRTQPAQLSRAGKDGVM